MRFRTDKITLKRYWAVGFSFTQFPNFEPEYEFVISVMWWRISISWGNSLRS